MKMFLVSQCDYDVCTHLGIFESFETAQLVAEQACGAHWNYTYAIEELTANELPEKPGWSTKNREYYLDARDPKKPETWKWVGP